MQRRMEDTVCGAGENPDRQDHPGTLAVPSILVAEDDPASLALIVRFLERLGLRNPVVGVTDGDEAVDRLARMDPPPVVTLLDIAMPGRCGIEVLAWVRAQPRLADLTVVLLTGVVDAAEVDEAHRLGAASYLVKPVGYQALGDVLANLGLPWSLHHPDVLSSAAAGDATRTRS